MTDSERESLLFHIINSVAEYRGEGRGEFADGIAYAVQALGVDEIEPGFKVSLDGLPFTSFAEVRSIIARCRKDSEDTDSDEALLLRGYFTDRALGRRGQLVGLIFRDAEGPGIKFTWGTDSVFTTWRPTEAEATP